MPVFVLDFDGTLISSILPPTPIKTDVKVAQMQTASSETKRFEVAYPIIKAKLERNLKVLQWIGERYDIDKHIRAAKGEALSLYNAKTISQIRTTEGRVALRYWQAYQSIMPECFTFEGRTTGKHNNNATDPINLALNYGYGVLGGEVRKAINSVGFESSIGFLHDYSDYQTKQSLVYDLQEPFRWLVDVTVLKAVESGALDLKDFYFLGNDYRYHFDVAAKRRFLRLLKDEFNSGVKYKDSKLKWDTVVLRKTQELAKYLSGKAKTIDFTEPAPNLERIDSQQIRSRILQLSQSEAKQLGIGKSTLHYLRKHAKSEKSFKTYNKTVSKLTIKG